MSLRNTDHQIAIERGGDTEYTARLKRERDELKLELSGLHNRRRRTLGARRRIIAVKQRLARIEGMLNNG